jgi:hypothetical protein
MRSLSTDINVDDTRLPIYFLGRCGVHIASSPRYLVTVLQYHIDEQRDSVS